MKELEYPFEAKNIVTKRLKYRRRLLSEDVTRIKKKIAILGGSTTNDIMHEYQNSSIFVFSSRFEGFGMVIVEAMSCGLPIVSFDCPCGPREIVSRNNDGLMVENGRIDQLASALIKVMSDESLRIQFASNARKNSERFKIEKIAQKWKFLFDSLHG